MIPDVASPPEKQTSTLMAADTLPNTTAPPVAAERRVLIPRISWEAYVAFGDELARQDCRSVRLTYDRGSLEIMTTGAPHEWYKEMLGNLFVVMVYELGIEKRSGGQMTFRRKDLRRGLEPDRCWWIAHEQEMRTRDDFDPHNDPPPDLALEIEISNPLLNKVSIYAALGVPEIWRYDGQALRFWERRDDNSYRQVETSIAFPFLRPEHLLPYLRIDDEMGETRRLRQFAAWLRENHSRLEE